MKIIDTHCHLGASRLSPLEVTEKDLLESMDGYGVEMSLVMPHAVSDDPAAEHDRVADLCCRHSGRFRGIVNLSPLWNEEDYSQEARRCVNELDFVAIKLNPMQHLVSPIMDNAEKVFEAASLLGVPVIVHTGLGAPWALPSLCILPARRYPDIPIILAHAGFAVYTSEAFVAASVCENIFLEPSWSTVSDLKWLVNGLGAERVLFGSDLPENLPVELSKYRAAGLSETELERCLGGTAETLFHLQSGR